MSASNVHFVGGSPDATIDALERLLLELHALRRGDAPDLAGAPLISDWRTAQRIAPALVGSVEGHPLLSRGPVMTSELFAIDPALRWARTLSRYYRLGTRIHDGEVR